MNHLRSLLVALLVLLTGCHPAALAPTSTVAPVTTPVLRGELVEASGYVTQANATQVRANATVTLIDPTTFQAKGTGITATDGTFAIQAMPTFTPVMGALYLLESSKALGGSSNAAFRLRTLVQLNPGGWTSTSGTGIQLSSATTAVSILWDQLALGASDVVAKVSYDAATGTHRFQDLNPTVVESKVREVHALVQEALRLNLDPIQLVRPGPGGAFQLGLASTNVNMLPNSSFETTPPTARGWYLYNPASVGSYSVDPTAYDGRNAIKLSASGAGDMGWCYGTMPGVGTSGLTFQAGHTYTLSVYARGAAGGERLALYWSPEGGTTSYSLRNETLGTTYQRYALTFTPTTSGPRGLILIKIGSVAGQASFPANVYVDAVQLEEGLGATGYEPQGTLLLDGFGAPLDMSGVTPADGKIGRGIMVDNGLNVLSANSSFETDGNNDGIPDGLTQFSGTGGTYSLDADALFGAKSLKIVKTSASTDFLNYGLTYSFRAGHTYTFSFWMKGQGVSGTPNASDCGLYVDGLPVGGGWEPFTLASPTGTFDWTRLTLTHTFVKDCGSVNFYPMFRNKTGTVWFDGMQIEEGFTASPYAGDAGTDRLIYNAARVVNPAHGTLSYWYRPTYGWGDDRGTGYLMEITNAPSNAVIFCLSMTRTNGSTPNLQFGVHDGTNWNGANWQPDSPGWLAGTWHHVALSWGARGMEFYVDGSLVASNGYTGPVGGSMGLGQLYFSGTSGNSGVCANGTIDGLKIWDLQKSPDWIRREALGITQ